MVGWTLLANHQEMSSTANSAADDAARAQQATTNPPASCGIDGTPACWGSRPDVTPAPAYAGDGTNASTNQDSFVCKSLSNEQGMVQADNVIDVGELSMINYGSDKPHDGCLVVDRGTRVFVMEVSGDHTKTKYGDNSPVWVTSRLISIDAGADDSSVCGTYQEPACLGSVSARAATVVTTAPAATCESSTERYNDMPVIKGEALDQCAAERANVRGTINRPVQACGSHGGECYDLTAGTKVIVAVPTTSATGSESITLVELVKPEKDQTDLKLLSVNASAVDMD